MPTRIATLILATVQLCGFAAASISPSTGPHSELSVRVPPFLDPRLNGSQTSLHESHHHSNWEAPPSNFYAGTWYLTNTSSPYYRNLSNLQWDLRPILPSCLANNTAACPTGTLDGDMAELSTWIAANESSSQYLGALGGGGRPVGSLFAYDRPHRHNHPHLGPAWDGVFDTVISTGSMAGYKQSWTVIYWGLDGDGEPFQIVYESAGIVGSDKSSEIPPCLDAWSRSPDGPRNVSLTHVLHALEKLGNQDLTDLVRMMDPVKWNHELPGGSAICGKSCLENKSKKSH